VMPHINDASVGLAALSEEATRDALRPMFGGYRSLRLARAARIDNNPVITPELRETPEFARERARYLASQIEHVDQVRLRLEHFLAQHTYYDAYTPKVRARLETLFVPHVRPLFTDTFDALPDDVQDEIMAYFFIAHFLTNHTNYITYAPPVQAAFESLFIVPDIVARFTDEWTMLPPEAFVPILERFYMAQYLACYTSYLSHSQEDQDAWARALSAPHILALFTATWDNLPPATQAQIAAAAPPPSIF